MDVFNPLSESGGQHVCSTSSGCMHPVAACDECRSSMVRVTDGIHVDVCVDSFVLHVYERKHSLAGHTLHPGDHLCVPVRECHS